MTQRQIRLSFGTRWRIQRARFSIHGLLARYEERKVVSLVAAINGGLAIMIISLAAWLSDCPLIFPALGPTAFIMFSAPLSATATPRCVIVAHLTAMGSGYGVWHLIGFLGGAPVSIESGGWPMLCSASLAMAVACLLLIRLSCPHASAVGSCLIVALGGVPLWHDLLFMALAVLLMAALAVVINRAANLPIPIWRANVRQPNEPIRHLSLNKA